jgi:flagellar assembly protein FliH
MSEATAERTKGAAERWEVPAIDGSDGKGFLTARRLQDLQKEAYDEAYQVGLADGQKAGEKEIEVRAEHLDKLLNALARPFDELDERVEQQLVELSMSVVRQLFRREIRTDPSHIIGVVHEAIQLLPVASRNIRVFLHPEDARLVAESLSPSEGERAWNIVEDPLINRGGCTVNTDSSRIDAQAETRLNTVINSIAGDRRDQ